MTERARAKGRRAGMCRAWAPLAWLLVAPLAGCKPVKPDVVAAAREVAAQRAAEARQTASGQGAIGRLGTPGGGLEPETAATVVAQVGESTITLGDMAEYLSHKSKFDRARFAAPEARRELLEDMVRIEVLAREGMRRGLDSEPTVRTAFKKALAEALLEQNDVGGISLGEVPEAEVRAWYEAHEDSYERPATREAILLVLNDEQAAREARAKIAAALARSPDEARALIQATAAERSFDARSRADRGQLGTFDREGRNLEGQQRIAPDIVDQAFAVDEAPALAPLRKLDSGTWSVLLVTAAAEAGPAPLEAVRVQIQGELLAERRQRERQALVDRLRAEAKVDFDAAALKTLSGSEQGGTGRPAAPADGARLRVDNRALRRAVIEGPKPGATTKSLGGDAPRRLTPEEIQRHMQQQRDRKGSSDTGGGAP